jgi:hypothetical protein
MKRLSGYWQQLLGTVGTSLGEGGEILKTKFWLLNVAQNPMLFFRRYSLLHQDKPCNPSSRFVLGQASVPTCCNHFAAHCRICLRKIGTVVSCSMKCQSERKSGLIRNLTALRDLRILEVGAGHATLQIMVFLGSGSSKWLTFSVVEVLRLVQFLTEVLGARQNMGQCCCYCLWHGYQQCHGPETLGATIRKSFFRFRIQAVATMCDPPHHLKCTRNLFLKYDVQLESEHMDSHLPVVAK